MITLTVPLDMGLTFGIGMTFGMAGEDEVKGAESATDTSAFRKGLLYNTIVGVGIAVLCYMICPDWMLMYYTDHKKIPRLVKIGMFSMYNLMYSLGFLSVGELESRQEGLSRMVYGCVMGILGLYILLSTRRLCLVGTTDQYEKGEARLILKTGIAPALLGGGAAGVLLLVKMLKGMKEQQ